MQYRSSSTMRCRPLTWPSTLRRRFWRASLFSMYPGRMVLRSSVPIYPYRVSAPRCADRGPGPAGGLQSPRIPSPSSLMPLARASAKCSSHSPHLLAPRLVRPAPGHGRERVVRRERGWRRPAGPPFHARPSIAGARRAALVRTCASSRSLKAGSTSRPKSSSDSQMCSWRFLPACRTKMTWSTPACSNRSRYSRTCCRRSRRPAQPCAVASRPAWPPGAPGAVPSRSRASSPGRRAARGIRSRRRSTRAGAPRRRSSARASSRRSSHPPGRGRAPPSRRGGTSSASRTRCSG